MKVAKLIISIVGSVLMVLAGLVPGAVVMAMLLVDFFVWIVDSNDYTGGVFGAVFVFLILANSVAVLVLSILAFHAGRIGKVRKYTGLCIADCILFGLSTGYSLLLSFWMYKLLQSTIPAIFLWPAIAFLFLAAMIVFTILGRKEVNADNDFKMMLNNPWGNATVNNNNPWGNTPWGNP